MTQKEALQILKTGVNVFLTGEPGSGKTYTINEYVKYLRSNGIEPAITASTGIAATHIGGATVHSWSGIGIKDTLTKQDLHALMDNKRVVGRIKKTQVLIIDEISMLSANTFTLIEKVCRTVKESDVAFGGLQIVVVGDFFQLPPVIRRQIQSDQEGMFPDEGAESSPFAFSSPAWKELDPTICYLIEQHRQEDELFLNALNSIRRGEVTDEARECFTARIVTSLPNETITKLYPHNKDVDRLNELELKKLSTQAQTFAMHSRGAPPLIEGLKRNCLSPESLVLKAGARVMFTKNHPEGRYVNGTLGEVVGFDKESGRPIVKTRAGKTIVVEATEWAIQDGPKVLAAIAQFPLRLAWAITVHKSQGMSLDAAVMDLRASFEYGQGYVALSRVRTLDGLHLLGFNTRALEVHPIVAEQDGRFRTASETACTQLKKLDPAALEAEQAAFILACGGGQGSGPQESKPKVPTYEVTKDLLLKDKQTLEQIANDRRMTIGTIIGHLEIMIENGELNLSDLTHLKPKNGHFKAIEKVLKIIYSNEGKYLLSQAREVLGASYSFDEIRLVRLYL